MCIFFITCRAPPNEGLRKLRSGGGLRHYSDARRRLAYMRGLWSRFLHESEKVQQAKGSGGNE